RWYACGEFGGKAGGGQYRWLADRNGGRRPHGISRSSSRLRAIGGSGDQVASRRVPRSANGGQWQAQNGRRVPSQSRGAKDIGSLSPRRGKDCSRSAGHLRQRFFRGALAHRRHRLTALLKTSFCVIPSEARFLALRMFLRSDGSSFLNSLEPGTKSER